MDAAKAAQTGGGKVAGVQLDVSDRQQVATLWDKVPQDLRNVDVLGNCLQLSQVYNILLTTEISSEQCWFCSWRGQSRDYQRGRRREHVPNERLRSDFHDTVTHPWSVPEYDQSIFVIYQIMSDFKERRNGHIINIGSVAGREPYAGGSIYCATKHAVRAFTGALMREVVDTPIRVTEIQPGPLFFLHCQALGQS